MFGVNIIRFDNDGNATIQNLLFRIDFAHSLESMRTQILSDIYRRRFVSMAWNLMAATAKWTEKKQNNLNSGINYRNEHHQFHAQ